MDYTFALAAILAPTVCAQNALIWALEPTWEAVEFSCLTYTL